MRCPVEQTEVAMSGMKGKVSRKKAEVEKMQFDWPSPKDENVVYNDTKGTWVVQSTEGQAFSKILDETCGEDVVNSTAMLSDQQNQTFGDVLENQYQHDNSEWWNDPTIVAHLADASLKKVMYRHPDTDVLHAEPAHLTEACLLYTSPSPRDRTRSRMPSSA